MSLYPKPYKNASFLHGEIHVPRTDRNLAFLMSNYLSDSPLMAEAIAHLFSYCVHEEVGSTHKT